LARLVPGARQRRLAREQLRLAFPEKSETERDCIGRASFVNLGRAALETARADRMDIRSLVDLDPRDEALLHAAHAEGKGIVVVTAHIGAWSCSGAAWRPPASPAARSPRRRTTRGSRPS